MSQVVAATIAKKMMACAATLSNDAIASDLKMLGVRLKTDIEAAVMATPVKDQRRSLKDGGMSGFGNDKLQGYFRSPTGPELVMQPKGRQTGQFSILQSGRRAYKAGDRRSKGFTPKGRQKIGKISGNVGAQAGKGTWTDAERRMRQNAERDLRKVRTEKLLTAFTRG